MHYNGNKPTVVAYWSRALSAFEQSYRRQIEREALAVVWACEYFHLYIFCALVEVITDHKALATLYGNPSAKLPVRLERWAIRLLQYQPMIEYRKGCDNSSDNLSRYPHVSEKSSREELVAEEYVNFIAAERVPKAMSYAKVLAATLDGSTLSAVK